jgi:S-adenosylmethionine hydrolase
MLGDGVFDVNGRRFPRKATYADVPEGQPVLVIDSEGRVELALNMGSLGAASGWKAGTSLRIIPAK